HEGLAAEAEQGVAVGMIADLMARGGDGLGDGGQAIDIGSDLEERGGDAMLFEEGEDFGSGFAGPIVEGESDGAAVTRTAPDRIGEDGGRPAPNGPRSRCDGSGGRGHASQHNPIKASLGGASGLGLASLAGKWESVECTGGISTRRTGGKNGIGRRWRIGGLIQRVGPGRTIRLE